jgi:hypothetical protein
MFPVRYELNICILLEETQYLKGYIFCLLFEKCSLRDTSVCSLSDNALKVFSASISRPEKGRVTRRRIHLLHYRLTPGGLKDKCTTFLTSQICLKIVDTMFLHVHCI